MLLSLFGGCIYWIIKLSLPDTNAYNQLYFLCLLQFDLCVAKWSFHLPPLWHLYNFCILTIVLFILVSWPNIHFIDWKSFCNNLVSSQRYCFSHSLFMLSSKGNTKYSLWWFDSYSIKSAFIIVTKTFLCLLKSKFFKIKIILKGQLSFADCVFYQFGKLGVLADYILHWGVFWLVF